MSTLHFAQLSDVHISSLGDHHDQLSGRAADFLTNIVTKLNQIDDLDFVLFTGDLFDVADQWELGRFQEIIHTLGKPYFIIPGNHDHRAAGQAEGLTRHQFARHFNPQVNARPTAPDAQNGYWSMALNSQVQLIGLDSNRDEDWGGIIDGPQMKWLENELSSHAGKLVIMAVHHPLHNLAPIDDDPKWSNFVCDNGPELLTLLDDHPQVKVVLTGHHHLTKIDKLGQRLHMACPALCLYPCAYRTFQLTQQADQTWHLKWQWHNATDESTIAEARQVMVKTWQEVGFDPDFVQGHVELALGSEYDRNRELVLG
jgi:3',5'-cyclic AMP phosphodiesterase CpdA